MFSAVGLSSPSTVVHIMSVSVGGVGFIFFWLALHPVLGAGIFLCGSHCIVCLFPSVHFSYTSGDRDPLTRVLLEILGARVSLMVSSTISGCLWDLTADRPY